MLGAIIVAPLLLIAIFYFGSHEAHRWLAVEVTEHRAAIEALRGGRWPDGPAGRPLALFESGAILQQRRVERVIQAGCVSRWFAAEHIAKRIRRYWELQAWLVAEAEEVMLEEAAGDVEFNPSEVRAAFAELDGLKRALGRSTFAALQALLPFSRNDQWEVAELKQRLNRR